MAKFTLEVPEQGGKFTLEMPTPEAPSVADRILTSVPGRLLTGVKSSLIDGAAEYAPYVLGNVASGFGAYPNSVSEGLLNESRRVRQLNADTEAEWQAARQRTGQSGTEYVRGAGELLGAATLGLALPAAPATTGARALYGAATGGASAAFAPTREVDDKKFAEAKAMQAGAGAVAGGIATPVVGKIFDVAGPVIDRVLNKLGAGPKLSDQAILDRITFEMKRDGVDFSTFPESVRKQVAKEVGQAMRGGEKLDGAALARKLDMDRFGGGTQGQITRDPMQWNREFNMRQVEGAGEPLVSQALKIRQQTGQMLGDMGASSPRTPYEAGNVAIDRLSGIDSMLKGRVDASYNAARAADGRYAPLNTAQFSKLANDALDAGQWGVFLPEEAKSLLNKVSTGEIPLDVNTATQLQTRLSELARGYTARGERAPAGAIGQVIDALRKTDILDAAPGAVNNGTPKIPNAGDQARAAFNEAKAAAAARFKIHEKIPAMKAAIDGDITPEKFVSKFVLGDTVDNVAPLMRVLPEEGKQAVREQVAKYLERSAFGANTTGDGPMAVASFNKALQTLGPEKLNAIFPEEIVTDLYRIGRVNAYVTQQPAGVTPNRSGTAGALMNLLSRAKGFSMGIGPVRGVVQSAQVANALSPKVPTEPLPVLTPTLADLLRGVPVGAGVLTIGQ